MIDLLILNTKESERFPGKNELLMGHTVDWIKKEVPGLTEDFRIVYVTRENMRTMVPKIDNLLHLQSPDCDEISSNHKAVLKWIVDRLDTSDKFVLLQLSQPVRRRGLLQDCIDAIKDDNVVLSYSVGLDDSWRIVDHGTLDREYTRNTDLHKMLDGCVYGWVGDPAKIFDLKNQNKAWVSNGVMPVVDLDYRWQYHSEFVKGVEALCNQNCKIYNDQKKNSLC